MTPVIDSISSHSKRPAAPQKVTFTNSAGKIAEFFLKDNPWKLPKYNDFQKIYRFCIICGDNRYPGDKWSGIIDCMGPPTICKKSACWDALEQVPGFVPRKHYIIESDCDKIRTHFPKTKEYFEEIESRITTIRFDRVFKSESEIPEKYKSTFSMLEDIPVEHRISKIDSFYFEYKNKYGIEVGKTLLDTKEPYLLALAKYRQQCVKILEKIN